MNWLEEFLWKRIAQRTNVFLLETFDYRRRDQFLAWIQKPELESVVAPFQRSIQHLVKHTE